MNLTDAMWIAKEGFDGWAAKPHNRRWAGMIDGTPIQNDLPINIAEAFVAALSLSGEKVGMREALEEGAREMMRVGAGTDNLQWELCQARREKAASDFAASILAALGLPPPVVGGGSEKVEDLGLVASKPMLPGRIEPDREPAYPCSPHCAGYLREQALREQFRTMLATAFEAGCWAVHVTIEGHEPWPECGEAAQDYATSVLR